MRHDAQKARLGKLANAYQISCALYAAAELKLEKHLANGPLSAEDLADRLGAQPEPLTRLLRFLHALQVVRFEGEQTVHSTGMTASLAQLDNLAEGAEAAAAWLSLAGALRSDQHPFEVAHDTPFYEYAERHPAKAERWSLRNRLVAASWAGPLADALPMSGNETIVDLGAGNIELASAFIRRYPACKPVLFDLPHEAKSISRRLAETGLEARIAVEEGDLVHDAPPQADLFLFCRVLLNFDDARLKTILSLCRKSMRGQSRIVIAEPLMPPPGDETRASCYAHDLHLWAMWGGKQRTYTEYDSLLKDAGLLITECTQVEADDEFICDLVVAEQRDD